MLLCACVLCALFCVAVFKISCFLVRVVIRKGPTAWEISAKFSRHSTHQHTQASIINARCSLINIGLFHDWFSPLQRRGALLAFCAFALASRWNCRCFVSEQFFVTAHESTGQPDKKSKKQKFTTKTKTHISISNYSQKVNNGYVIIINQIIVSMHLHVLAERLLFPVHRFVWVRSCPSFLNSRQLKARKYWLFCHFSFIPSCSQGIRT